MPRWLRILVTLVAAGFGAWAGLLGIGGAAAGFAWIFIFGDDPWPSWAEPAIVAVAALGALALACSAAWSTWRWTAPKAD